MSKDNNTKQGNVSKITDDIFKPTASTITETRNNSEASSTRRIDTYIKNDAE